MEDIRGTADATLIAELKALDSPVAPAQPGVVPGSAPSAPPNPAADPQSPGQLGASTPDPAAAGSQAAPFDVSSLPPETQAFIAKFGGDPLRALDYARAIADGLGKPDAPAPVAAPEPAPEPEITAAPPPPMDAAQLDTTVKGWLSSDPAVAQWRQSYNSNLQRLNTLTQALPELNQKFQIESLRLKVPEIVADVYQSQAINSELLRLRQEILATQQEQYILNQQQRDLDQAYRAKDQKFREHYQSEYQKWADTQTQALSQQQQVAQYKQVMKAIWPTALDRAAKANNIPADLMGEFDSYVQQAALANSQRITPQNLEDFMVAQAKSLNSQWDKHHRIQSARYAEMAHQRTAATTGSGSSPSMTPGQGQAPQPAPGQPEDPSQYKSVEDIQSAHTTKLRAYKLF